MTKDFKTGLFLGLLLMMVTAVWFARNLRPGTQAKIMNIQNTHSPQEDAVDKVRFVTNLPSTTTSQQTAKNKTSGFHIVNKGETLSMIAERYYGSITKWRKIHNANPHIKDPNKLLPGKILKIP
ncbi:MAG: LysM peptidoglycan-binding domain-containing protein [Planctomycetota bacterium]|jgi:nucleoid-associated protein YgaU